MGTMWRAASRPQKIIAALLLLAGIGTGSLAVSGRPFTSRPGHPAAAQPSAALLVPHPTVAPAEIHRAPAHPAPGREIRHGRFITMCGFHEHRIAGSRQYSFNVIENDNFGGQAECVRTDLHPDFTVTRSAAVVYAWQAYPVIWRGCSWGVCSPLAHLPLRVSSLGRGEPWVTWSTRQRAPGRWNAAIDMWFSATSSRTGPYEAEVMVWIGTHLVYPLHDAPVFAIDHAFWQFRTWQTHFTPLAGSVLRWRYIQFRREGSVTAVTHLRLRPFIVQAEELGLIQPGWYLDSVMGGFEIVQGGTGLATTYFHASP